MNTNSFHPGDGNPSDGRGSQGAFPTGAPTEREETFDFWRTAQRALRGRYRFAFLLAACGAAAGAGTGMMLGKRLYTATGMVRIASVLPQVLRETDQNRPMANFDGFIQSQREVMTSRETIHAAMKDDLWLDAGPFGQSPTEEQFAAGLKVETRPRSDNLRVTFTNKDPGVAAAAVGSIVAAFQKAFEGEQHRVEDQRMGQLTERRDSLSAELQKLEAQIDAVAEGRTGTELEPLYLAAVERVKKLRGALADVQCAIAGGPDMTQSPRAASRLPAEVVADELLRSCTADQTRVESELAEARSWGCGPSHPQVRQLEAAATRARERVAKAIEVCRATRAVQAPQESPVSLGEREESLRKYSQFAEDEMKRLAGQRDELAVLGERAATLRTSLRETDSRLDALRTEASLGSRLSVISGGDKPMTALRDNRAKTAVLGAMLGTAFPLGVLILGASVRRRYRFCDEVAHDLMNRVPFVAVLPDLAESEDMGAAAAHSVHSLRVRLQPRVAGESRTYLVTSASHAEGKTGLSLALGLSFAAAGFRTLLVDCDPDSRGLTREFNADDSPGMIEATGGEEASIRRVRAGLSVMTAGRCRPRDACRIAPAASMRTIAALRERFDVVLLDAGPVLTGITASVMAPQVDGVIFALARGQEQSVVQNSIRHIGMLGAVMAAGVFNRAAASEFREGMSHIDQSSATAEASLPDRLRRFGPLVAATLASLSLTREDDLDLLPGGISLARPETGLRAVA